MASTAFDPAKDIPSLKGKVVFITGGNTGIGEQVALDLSSHEPEQLWIAGRNTQSGNAAIKKIHDRAPGVSAHFVELDLTSFDSIKTASKTFKASADRLDILVLNGGVFGGPNTTTNEGYELRFGTNHVGHALLTKLFTPLLSAAASNPLGSAPRIVSVSSAGHRMGKGGIIFESLKGTGESLTIPERYCQSKLANVLFAKEMAKRYPQFTTVAVNPGEVKTGLFTPDAGLKMRIISTLIVPFIGKTIPEGAKNHLWAATAKDAKSGTYYEPIGVSDKEGPAAKDAELAKKLWDWTEQELKGHDA